MIESQLVNLKDPKNTKSEMSHHKLRNRFISLGEKTNYRLCLSRIIVSLTATSSPQLDLLSTPPPKEVPQSI